MSSRIKNRKQAIVVLSICVCCCLVVSLYLLSNDITSSGGEAMRDDAGMIQSIDGYSGLIITGVLLGMLIAVIFGGSKNKINE